MRKIILYLIIILLIVNCNNKRIIKYNNYYNKIKDTINNENEIKKVQKSFRIIAFSFISDALRNMNNRYPEKHQEVSELIEKIVFLSLSGDVCPYKNINSKNKFGNDEYGLYLTHLNIILSNYLIITGSKKYSKLHNTVNKFFIDHSIDDVNLNFKIYPGSSYRFAADQSAALYSLWLYDKAYNTKNSKNIIKKWLSILNSKGLNKNYNLPVSELSNALWYSQYPRGCATPYLIYYISYFSPDSAKTYWYNFKKYFKGNLLSYMLFREWLDDFNNKNYMYNLAEWKNKYGINGDLDSGPLILEYGAAATGFGLLAAKAVNDKKSYNNLYKSIDRGFKVLAGSKKLKSSLENFLSISIIFLAETI